MSNPYSPVLTGREARNADEYIEGEWILPPKYESTTQKGLYFWAEENGGGAGAIESYCVVSQVEGFPPTEAFDDWLCHWKDADEIAQKLARGEDCSCPAPIGAYAPNGIYLTTSLDPDRMANMKPCYHILDNIGTAKYVVSHHDGHKTHKDGSPFFDLQICKSKREVAAFIRGLKAQGYSERN